LILLDANALISFLLDEPGASEVEGLMRSRECGMPAPCVAEVRDLLIRRHAVTEERFLARVGPLADVMVVGLPVDIPLAQWAGDIRAAHYSRKESALSLADCLLLASAENEDEIATADPSVIRIARALDIGVIPLLDSQGRRPGR
jgi:PIN domain nuclease of toxin-antitoxin system